MTECSISIIIPAYNVVKYLAAALQSIRDQTSPPDEVILIDDGSTDGTLELAKEFEFPMPYKIVSVENRGQGNARNLGLSLASSEYVYFFDSDDLLAENFIQSVKNVLVHHQKPDIVLFSGESFHDSEYRGKLWANYRRNFSGAFDNRTAFLERANAHHALQCSPCLYVSQKKLWGANGLQFDADFHQDAAIFFPLLFACHTFVVLDQVFFYRRFREGSTMTMLRNEKHVNGSLNCMQRTLSLYHDKNLNDAERRHVRKMLQFFCIHYIKTARDAHFSVKIGEVVKVLVAIGSVKFFSKALVCLSGADRFDVVRRAGRFINRVRCG